MNVARHLSSSLLLALLSPVGPLVTTVSAQVMTFRKVVAVGQNQLQNVREVDIAVGGDRAMVVFIHDKQIGYSYYDGSQWEEGVASEEGFDDPSVVYGTFSLLGAPQETFLLCYRNPGKVKVRAFDLSTGAFPPTDNSVTVDEGELPFQAGYDKSWAVAGHTSGTYNDLHVTWHHAFSGDNLRYGYSGNGGQTWFWQSVEDRLTMDVPTIKFCAQPTIGDTSVLGPIYVAYRVNEADPVAQRKIKFFMGEAGASTPTGWRFEHLRDLSQNEVEVVLHSNPADWGNDVPGKHKISSVPYLVADPTNPNVLYLIFNDHKDGSNVDFDVFCVKLTRSQPSNSWTAGSFVRVNNDLLIPGEDRDQFAPAAAVDNQGRLHVVFYDDRRFSQPDDEEDDAKFDVYYAASLDGGVTFSNIRLAAVPDEPALQTIMTGAVTTRNTPAEYPGIVCDGDKVWIAFAGTWSKDMIYPDVPAVDRSVIYVATIQY